MQIHLNGVALALVMAGAFVVVVALSPLSLRLTLAVRGLGASVTTEITAFWGLLKFKGPRPAPGETARPRAPVRLRSLGRADYERALRYILARASCRRLSARVAFGTGDAASTGIGAGIVWAVAGAAVAVAREFVGEWDCVPAVSVVPFFHGAALEADFDCILAIRTGHAIFAALGLALRAMRRATFRGRASHPGPDEDSDGEHQGHGGRQHRGR
ncbi:MAG: DUF2953 domain-containing protein [Firmicutes bacterium]|nr:DUF2953 domain-containing protein [Bacillota bacterium]